MSVVSVKPIHPRRRASYRDGKYSFYLMFLVQCNAIEDGPAAAICADGIPPRGSAFVNVDGTVAYLSGIDVDPRGDADRIFEVQVSFEQDPTQEDDNPLHQPPGFSWTYQEATEPYFIDESTNGMDGGGVPTVNSAGVRFVPKEVRRGRATTRRP